ncbi:MAG: YidH family protein [Steroidobacteraceae bacterium]
MESVKENETANPPRSYGDDAACAMVYYAAERTLFAWVRAALGMMALGFVIDRFGLVLRGLPRQTGNAAEISAQHSFWAGTVLVLGGVAMAVVAAIRYGGLELRFRRDGCGAPGHGLPLGVCFALFLAVVGVAIAYYLVTVRY